MRKLRYIIFSFLLLCAAFSSGQRPKLDYMSKMPVDEIFKIAKDSKKPVLVFVHSMHCYTSRQFVREVMNKDEVAKTFRTGFYCMNADIGSRNGNSFARKHDLLMMPAMLLYSSDAVMQYKCQLKLDPKMILDQAECFLSACNIRSQIIMLKNTNRDMSLSEAGTKIGKSYARIDHRKISKGKNIDKNIYHYTLNMKNFRDFDIAYREEWEKLRNEPMKEEEIKIE